MNRIGPRGVAAGVDCLAVALRFRRYCERRAIRYGVRWGMPKRTNEFQQLVYLIQQQLRDRADTTVTESKMLTDRNTGKKREADIVVECTVNDVPLIIAFECRGRSRKPTIEWVEQMLKKHQYLSDKLVLVANHGFTTDAIDLANREGVDTVELSAARKLDWPAVIDRYTQLLFATFDFTIKTFTAEYDCPVGAPRFADQMLYIVDAKGGRASLPTAVQMIVSKFEFFGKPVADLWYNKPVAERRSEHTVTMQYMPPADEPMALIQGKLSYPLKKLVITVAARIGQAALNMKHAGYKEVQLAHGSATLSEGSMAGQTVRFLMTEQLGQLPKGAVMLSATKGSDQPMVRVGELNPGGPAQLRKQL